MDCCWSVQIGNLRYRQFSLTELFNVIGPIKLYVHSIIHYSVTKVIFVSKKEKPFQIKDEVLRKSYEVSLFASGPIFKLMSYILFFVPDFVLMCVTSFSVFNQPVDHFLHATCCRSHWIHFSK